MKRLITLFILYMPCIIASHKSEEVEKVSSESPKTEKKDQKSKESEEKDKVLLTTLLKTLNALQKKAKTNETDALPYLKMLCNGKSIRVCEQTIELEDSFMLLRDKDKDTVSMRSLVRELLKPHMEGIE